MIVSVFRILVFSLALIVLTGVAYPIVVTLLSKGLFPYQAMGSLVEQNGTVIGSSLIAQSFTGPGYFHPRPSVAGNGYAADNSGASNLGMTSKALNDTIAERVKLEHSLNIGAEKIPADLVTASGSGLDPDITPESARYQAQRISRARGIAMEDIQALIDRMTVQRVLGILGMPRVNVLAINIELDKTYGKKP